jgi:LysR family transcriptional regulator, benzoate and cis,cis-muconate-responsive activator of ben and cat genes
MELRHLRYFVAVAEDLHFGRAADRLGIAQPPLSQQIRRLEAELGTRLLHRTNRRVQLSDVGRTFLAEAKLTLMQADRARDVVRRAKGGAFGPLIIGHPPTAEVTVFPRVLPTFTRQHPEVAIALQTTSRPLEQFEMLRDGRIHVGFLRMPAKDSRVIVVPILREPLLAALPARHPLAKRRAVTLRALSSEPFVFFRRELLPGFYDLVMDIWRRAGQKPRGLEHTTRLHTMLSLVAIGRGVSLVPRSASGFGGKGVVCRPVRPRLPQVEFGIAYNPANPSGLVRAFLDVVATVFRTTIP